MTAAYTLAERHDVTLFEAASRLGGHTNTVDVRLHGETLAVDTGFIVFNERTYPNFCRLLRELGVDSQPSDMSFSVRSEASGWEYCGSSLNGLFAQRRNLLRPAFYRMLREILRFNRAAMQLLILDDASGPSLGEFLHAERFGSEFTDNYLLPMGAAIWSAPPGRMLDFPASSFARFFANHGLLSLRDRPQWRTVTGGSRRYLDAMLRARHFNVLPNSPVRRILRNDRDVTILANDREHRFDHVIVAAHADDALRMLGDATLAECEVLGSFPYQTNQATLHTDASLMPARRRAWASWNYRVPAHSRAEVTVTYWMNRLQRLDAAEEVFVTLNDDGKIDPAKALRQFTYHHPLYSSTAIAAQRRHGEISRGRTHYCGAYWGSGFHEDGVNSGLAAVRTLELSISTCKPASTRAASATAASLS